MARNWRGLGALLLLLALMATTVMVHAQSASFTSDDTTSDDATSDATSDETMPPPESVDQTPTPTLTATPTATATPSPTPTATPTTTPTPTVTPTTTVTPYPTPTLPPLTASVTARPAFTDAAAKIDPALVATLEQVLLTSAAQQIQAYAIRDPSLLATTSTSSYFQWISQTIRQSMDVGIAGARLDALSWTAIAVTSPATASISDRENWTMRYANGTTAAQESRWIYALVLSTDGTWKIQSATPVLEEG